MVFSISEGLELLLPFRVIMDVLLVYGHYWRVQYAAADVIAGFESLPRAVCVNRPLSFEEAVCVRWGYHGLKFNGSALCLWRMAGYIYWGDDKEVYV